MFSARSTRVKNSSTSGSSWRYTNGRGSRPTIRWNAATATAPSRWISPSSRRAPPMRIAATCSRARRPASTATRASPIGCPTCAACPAGSERGGRLTGAPAMFLGATRRNPPAAIQHGGFRRACAAILPARRARRLNPPYEGQGNRIWLAAWRWQRARHLLHLSPRAGRGGFATGPRAERSTAGEGACPQAQARGYAPSPGFLAALGIRPLPARVGEVAQAALPCTSRYQLKMRRPCYEGLGRPHPVDEVIDLGAQQVRLPGEVDRGGDDLVRHPVGFARRLAHARYGARHRLRAQRGLIDVAGDFPGGGVLLVHRARNRRGDVVDVVDGLADRPDGGDDLAGTALDGVDLGGDFLGRLGGLHRQVLHLLCHHGETAAGFAGARRLDSSIERQQVGLLGNRRDELHYLADALGGGGKAFGNAAGGPGLLDGGPGNVGGRRDLLTDLADRGGQLFRRASDGLDVVGGLVGRGRHDVGLAAGLVGGLAHRGGVLLEPGGGG